MSTRPARSAARRLLEATAPLRLPARKPPPAAPEAIRCSLREVKGISDAEIARIITGQPYTSLRDFWNRARVSRPVAERLVLIGAFDSLYAPAPNVQVPPRSLKSLPPQESVPPRSSSPSYLPVPHLPRTPSRRDLLARVGVLARQSSQARPGPHPAIDLFTGAGAVDQETADGLADLVPAGQLRELDLAERVKAELEILGFDVSQHVLNFYTDLLAGLGVVRSAQLADRENGESILVAGVKVATQTPAVRSGQRIIFASLDDAAGLVDLAFFESVQPRCAARLFGSWLLVARGRVRRAGAGPMAVTINATECWDLPALEQLRLTRGLPAVQAAMAAGDVGPAARPPPAPPAADPFTADPGAADPTGETARPVIFANGFVLSPYAETGAPGSNLKHPPRTLWHASPGSTVPPDALPPVRIRIVFPSQHFAALPACSDRDPDDGKTMRFEEFAATRLPALLRFSGVLTADRALAEDVVQEVLIRASKGWERIGQLDRPELYVRKMITNEYLSWRRRSWRLLPGGSAAEVDDRVAPDHAGQLAERDALLTELGKLPRRQRAVLVLRYYEGLSDPEIADVLGCTPGTVRGYASRALAALRVDLGPKTLVTTEEGR